MSRQVIVESRKWDGSLHRRTVMIELGTDQHGLWLYMPTGTHVQLPASSFVASAGLRLIPLGERWSVYFVRPVPDTGRPEQLYVDITTPATRSGDQIEFVDLDLDVERLDHGSVLIMDRDEFALNQQRWSYPPEEIAITEATATAVQKMIMAGEPPFDGSEGSWWRVVERQWAPG